MLRPDSIYVHLYANGVDTGVIAKLNESNHWSYIFGDLDVYKNGKKINYSLVEESVNGYVGSVSGDSEVGFVLTNTHTAKIQKRYILEQKCIWFYQEQL